MCQYLSFDQSKKKSSHSVSNLFVGLKTAIYNITKAKNTELTTFPIVEIGIC